MTAISAIGSYPSYPSYPSAPARPESAAPAGPPPGGPKGENSFVADRSKLSQVSDLLQTDEAEVTEQATNAATLIGMFQNKGVDLQQLRGVLSNGDLLDVSA
ncbi:hypothetical protein AB0J83_41095 [Actinoplanes sp. NPDC049596]|uniref:hypothetical protein n=1 Tax=unclassified Actinoplanes TaxID=2626549 RepID=UPI003428F18E